MDEGTKLQIGGIWRYMIKINDREFESEDSLREQPGRGQTEDII